MENFNILQISWGLAYEADEINDGHLEKLNLEQLLCYYVIELVMDELD